MKSQRNAQGIALHLLLDPLSPLFFISTIIISCYATLPLMSFFQSSFVSIIFTAFMFVPIIYCYSTPSFLFVFVSNPVLCCPCLLPLLSSIFIWIWYLISLAQFIVLSNLPHSVSFLNFSFAFASLLSCSWLQHRLFFFHPPPPMPYSLYIDSDSACCIFHPL